MSQAVAILRQIGPETNPQNDRGIHLRGLVFDATFSEKHESPAEVTENPVETGVSVADHMYMKPLRVTISAGVSDVVVDPTSNDQFSGGSSRSKKAFDLLTQLQATFEPFNVQTGLKLYKNMVCKNITSEQDKDTSRAFVFEAELQQVIRVTTQTVVLPPRAKGATQRQAGAVVQRGQVQSTQVTDPAKIMEISDFALGTMMVNQISGGLFP